ncbi:dihydrofolate reductase family protein [Streptomyces polygonati]|uniref:Dihydrofolate reductase family protein n=1 Tax=Streptomyces polygonati TaxID=1617087 RepID=A0ABV8HQ09_9ACTN
MAKTTYFTATSIDGFIADERNSLDWLLAADEGGEGGDRFGPFFAGVGAFAMGATTYEWVLAHDSMLEHPEKWHGYYGQTPCWVFTHRDLPAIPGADLTFVRGEVRPVHEAMAAAAGDRAIWLVGGGELVGAFADEGLLDELVLGVAPVSLGAGAPLLPRRLAADPAPDGALPDSPVPDSPASDAPAPDRPASDRLELTDVERVGGFAYLTYTVRRR